MPKMKTKSAAAKRFKRTAKGGFKSGNSFTSHRFHGKTKKQRRQLRGLSMMDKSNVKRYKKMIPAKSLRDAQRKLFKFVGGYHYAS